LELLIFPLLNIQLIGGTPYISLPVLN